MMLPAIKTMPPAAMFCQPRTVLIQKTAEKTSHIMPLARLYPGISAISFSLTVLPE